MVSGRQSRIVAYQQSINDLLRRTVEPLVAPELAQTEVLDDVLVVARPGTGLWRPTRHHWHRSTHVRCEFKLRRPAYRRPDYRTVTVVPVTPITALSPGTDPFKCDALTAVGTLSNAAGQLYIPNPQTGSFALPGQYREPWIMVGNLAFTYDLTPRISANITLANIFHTCFGGTSAAWTTAYGPSPNVCAYQPAGPSGVGEYVSNFYNGTSPNDVAANGVAPRPWQTQSYLPTQAFGDAAGTIPSPFTAFFQLTVKI